MSSSNEYNSKMQYLLVLFMIAVAAWPGSAWAADHDAVSNPGAGKTSPDSRPLSSGDRAVLNEQLARQQARIDQLERALEGVTQRLDQLEVAQRAWPPAPSGGGQVARSNAIVPARTTQFGENKPEPLVASAAPPPPIAFAPAPAAAPPAPSPSPAVAAVPAIPALHTAQPPESNNPQPSPLSFRIGDAEFTPGGFADFTNVFRSTNVGSGVATSFGTIPYSVISGAPNPAGRMTEYRALAQNSRISMKITSKVSGYNVTGYVESDFAGNNPNSLYVTSNSSTFRLRHYWVQLMRGKFEVLGGQAWTLMTPGRTGISPISTDVFISQVQDSNYQLGITWGRQSQLRLVYHPNPEWAMAVSIENPNQYLSTGVVLPSPVYNSQFDMAGNQTTTPNLHPDIVSKIAYDPIVSGRHMHAEVGGILRSFHDFTPATNSQSTITGGGVAAGVNIELTKDFRLIANGFYSYGGGRYILGLGPDVIVKPNGMLSGVHGGSGVAGFEFQANPSLLVFGYYGGAYFQRNTGYTLDATGKPVWVGFGAPTNTTTALNANRAVQEPTFGMTRTFWKSPKYGALLWVNQYSYVTRAPWIVPSATGKNAHAGVAYTDLRYVLP